MPQFDSSDLFIITPAKGRFRRPRVDLESLRPADLYDAWLFAEADATLALDAWRTSAATPRSPTPTRRTSPRSTARRMRRPCSSIACEASGDGRSEPRFRCSASSVTRGSRCAAEARPRCSCSSSATSGPCGRRRRSRPPLSAVRGIARRADHDRHRPGLQRARAAVPPRARQRASRTGPIELIAVVDGGDADVAAVAAAYCDQVLRIPKAGKRAAIAAGLRGQRPGDRRRDRARLRHASGRPARCASCSARSPTRASAASPPARRSSTPADQPGPPARELDGGHPLPPDGPRAVGLRPGRLPRRPDDRLPPRPRSRRRSSGSSRQTVLGVPQHVGDDRVLTNELLRAGWRTVYQSTALVETDAPSDWRDVLAPAAALGPLEPARDAAEPALALAPAGRVRQLRDRHRHPVRALRGGRPGHRARRCAGDGGVDRAAVRARAAARLPGDAGSASACASPPTSAASRATCARLPLFVLQITFVMVPIRIAAFATMFHQGWTSRPRAARPRTHARRCGNGTVRATASRSSRASRRSERRGRRAAPAQRIRSGVPIGVRRRAARCPRCAAGCSRATGGPG